MLTGSEYILFSSRPISESSPITAAESGRIFFLKENVEEMKSADDDIAIIGDLSDTKEDVMEWYRKIK